MFIPNEQDQILNTALEHLAGVGLEVLDAGAGGVVRVRTPSGFTQVYEVQLQSRVTPGTAQAVRPARQGRPLVVAVHVPEAIAEYWRAKDIHYVDSVGNMYLRLEGLVAEIRGRKAPPAPKPGEDGKPLRAFRSSGLKIIFSFLVDPAMVKASYREIAHATPVSLGTVHWVVSELATLGYLDPHARELHRAGELLNRWVDGYRLDLAPRLTLTRLDAPDPAWWAKAGDEIRAEGAQWGGETAAYFLTGHLRPSRAILYAPTLPTRLIGAHRFRKAEGEGNVEIRERFWHFETAAAMTVPTPLVYADLIASGDPRQMEAAAELREHDDLLRRLSRS